MSKFCLFFFKFNQVKYSPFFIKIHFDYYKLNRQYLNFAVTYIQPSNSDCSLMHYFGGSVSNLIPSPPNCVRVFYFQLYFNFFHDSKLSIQNFTLKCYKLKINELTQRSSMLYVVLTKMRLHLVFQTTDNKTKIFVKKNQFIYHHYKNVYITN